MLRTTDVLKWIFFTLGFLLTFNVYAERLYCEGTKELRCIGADQRVVKSSAVCFENMQCGHEGFVCKTTLDDLAGEHEALRQQYSELADTHNQLIDTYERSTADYEQIELCINRATTLEQAKDCI